MSSAAGNNAQWYLFFLSPFLAAMVAIKNYQAAWAKNIVWAFVVFFGFTFGMAKETSVGKSSSDIFRNATELRVLYHQQLSFQDIKELYKKNDDLDVLKLTIAILVSRLTENPQILLGIYGFIFGFFFSRNIWYLLERLNGPIKGFTILFLVAFILVNPFWNINGFRFYTAAQIFIYGLLPFLYEGKKKGLLLSAFSLLVHFSFVVPVLVLLIYAVFRNRTVIYFILFIGSTITSEINLKGFNSFVEARAPKALSERTSSYRSERYVKDFRTGGNIYFEQSSWHAVYYQKALNWVLTAFIIYLFFKRKQLSFINKGLLNAFAFILLITSVANILSSLPSGGRYLTVANLAALSLIAFYTHEKYQNLFVKRLKFLLVPAMLLFIVVSLRMGFYSLSLNTFIGNPIVAMIADYNFPLNDFIK
jgi:hypothetical protein